MSGNFSNKDYSKYFQSLEKRINNTTDIPKSPEVRQQSIQRKSPKNQRRIYKVVRLRFTALLLTILIITGIIFCCVKLVGVIKTKSESGDTESISSSVVAEEKKDKPAKIVYKETNDTQGIPASNDAKCAIIINTKTNDIVAARNPHQRSYPASTTKVMTLLTAVENITDFNDTFTMTLSITDPLFEQEASVAGFVDGEVISMTDLLYGMILPSGADAAMGLAIKIAGSEENFVELMNKKVESLGLKDTHFANVSGLHNKKNYSSAYDLAVILNAAMQNKTCREVLTTYQHTTASTPQHPEGILLSSTLFTYMYGDEPETSKILGGKTGFVNESGYCLASFGQNNTSMNEYIIVTLGNSARWPAFYGQIDLYKEFAK